MSRPADSVSIPWGDLARGGVVGGLAGGIILAMFMMIVTGLKGVGLLRPLYLVAATFHSQWAMVKGVEIFPILVGLMFHMMNSAIFGLIFALVLGAILRERSAVVTMWVVGGVVWGLILFIVNQYVILPLVDPAMAMGAATVLFWWIVAHLMYGFVLGVLVASPVGVRRIVAAAGR